MLYFLLFIIAGALVMIYFQMRFLIKVSLEDREKIFLAFNEQDVNRALNELRSSVIKLENSRKEYDINLEKAKIKHGDKLTTKELEADLKSYWEAEYEKEERLASYHAIIEANIAVRTGKKTIKEAKVGFNEKFEFSTFKIMKKVEERWEETQKVVKNYLKK